MTLIGSFFVGASLVILVVVMAIMDGFQEKLKDTYRGSSADAIVTPRYPVDLTRLQAVLLESLGSYAEAAAPYYESVTFLKKEGLIDPALEPTYHFAKVCGVDGRLEQRVNRFGEYVDRPTSDRQRFLDDPSRVDDDMERAMGTVGVIVGKDLLRELGLVPGQRVRMFSILPDDSAADDADPSNYRFRYELFQIVGRYDSSNSEIDRRTVFMDHDAFRKFFDSSTSRPSARIRLAAGTELADVRPTLDRERARIVRASVDPNYALRPGDGAFSIDSWKSENQTLVRAIESEKSMILSIAFLIVVAGASSIFAAQWLLVTDKIREIGILRALGAQVGGVVAIFVGNGLLMGLLGSVGGALVGLLAVNRIDDVHALISTILGRPVFDPNIYLFEKIPTRVDYGQVAQFALAALICTLFASAVPALRAGFMDPAKALHRD
jgi:lipoprotein-releasing system permease protein